jgi:hypothetical protein
MPSSFTNILPYPLHLRIPDWRGALPAACCGRRHTVTQVNDGLRERQRFGGSLKTEICSEKIKQKCSFYIWLKMYPHFWEKAQEAKMGHLKVTREAGIMFQFSLGHPTTEERLFKTSEFCFGKKKSAFRKTSYSNADQNSAVTKRQNISAQVRV